MTQTTEKFTEQEIIECRKDEFYKIIKENKLVAKKSFKEEEAMHIGVNCLIEKGTLAKITKINNNLLSLPYDDRFKMIFDDMYSNLESVRQVRKVFFIYISFLAMLRNELPFLIGMNRTNLQNVLETTRTDVTHTDLEVHKKLLPINENYKKAFLKAEEEIVAKLKSKLNQQLNSAKLNALRNKIKKAKQEEERQAYMQELNKLEEKYKADFEIEKEAYPVKFLRQYCRTSKEQLPIEALTIAKNIIEEDADEIPDEFKAENFDWKPPVDPATFFSQVIANFLNMLEKKDEESMQPYQREYLTQIKDATATLFNRQHEKEGKKLRTNMGGAGMGFAENKKYNR
jgi:hypothetical protein